MTHIFSVHKTSRFLSTLIVGSTLFMILNEGICQGPIELPKVIPPAPNAASLGKFTEIPVSTYTGTPNITIPIWIIKEGKIQIPVSLSYHAGGIKVSEIASWVGLGWSLNAGGGVFRSVLGRADEQTSGGFLDTSLTFPIHLHGATAWYAYANGYSDGLPDNFFYNFSGNSGRFVFDKEGTIHHIPKRNVVISHKPVTSEMFLYNNKEFIPGWEIVTEEGVKYTFNAYEKTTSESIDFPNGTTSSHQDAVTSWYLTSVISPTGDTVKFHYDNYSYNFDLPTSEKMASLVMGQGNIPQLTQTGILAQRQNIINGKRLSYIEWSLGKVRFLKRSNGRSDLIGDYALDKIVIEDASGNIRKQFVLDYEYLVGDQVVHYDSIDISGETNHYQGNEDDYAPSFSRRLLLKSVVEQDSNDLALNGGYLFTYIKDIGLPNRCYPVYDHWGYANYQEVSNPIFPKLEPIGGEYFFLGKDPDLSLCQAGDITGNRVPHRRHHHF